MEIISNLGMGFSLAFSPINMIYVTLGVIMGTIIGALPGIGPVAGVAMLIPLSFGMSPVTAMILMAGVYYGTQYGGTITAVLMKVPGESSAIMTCMDGYQMALKGRAGPALSIAAIGSYVAGTASVIMLMLMAPPIARIALSFGPPEYFALMLLGLTAVGGLTGASAVKGYLMGLVGLALSVPGMDLMTGLQRFTFGNLAMADGLQFLPVAVGLFGIAEVLASIERLEKRQIIKTTLREMLISWQDLKDSAWPIVRGTIIGFWVGVLPGAGGTIASFFAYAVEKKVSKHPEEFGTGRIEGVASPESANNSSTGGSLVPMLTLGIPGSATTAVMMGALTLFNIQPGPFLFANNPDLVWGLIASMYIGNVMLLVLNIVFVPLFVPVLRIPYTILAPLIVIFCVVGVYSLDYSMLDLWVLFVFSLAGYLMKKLDFPPAPLILALVLGNKMEMALRQSLKIAHGDISFFFRRPISGPLMGVVILIVLWPLIDRVIVQRFWKKVVLPERDAEV